jgi:hypothetical protein
MIASALQHGSDISEKSDSAEQFLSIIGIGCIIVDVIYMIGGLK